METHADTSHAVYCTLFIPLPMAVTGAHTHNRKQSVNSPTAARTRVPGTPSTGITTAFASLAQGLVSDQSVPAGAAHVVPALSSTVSSSADSQRLVTDTCWSLAASTGRKHDTKLPEMDCP